jgi:hypothetical protein
MFERIKEKKLLILGSSVTAGGLITIFFSLLHILFATVITLVGLSLLSAYGEMEK